ncbi:DHH family phosphoesterase [Jutongia hominis]|jgi:phosphoesterase RecJ-like protein|uniref:Bifunctional oligoribonuclease/PAP phosphatase NrnA n=1 Tax=Jutongia hominis TaxID=2763664 RepID=A0ABR7MTE4_9FIRM|nr:bifunctional oligoribonuclease/PAP phosphatase NrnA [Jutongia hominis]MBC8557084.1 bifunctional oligoribonuclease/PAP phosphatase NrnA [Jutongia hominis]
MNELRILSEEANDILIAGHIRPDGDCVGACIAAYHYLHNIYPEKNIEVYLENTPETFAFMDKDNAIISHTITDKQYDLFLALDTSSPDRLGEAQKNFFRAKMTMCVDHHISNRSYAGQNFIEPDASSACEVLYGLMADEDIDFAIAEALYIGIIFDSGVFRYSNTSKKTMEIAGTLMEKGIPFWDYIDKCFYERTYTQAQLLGRTLLASMRVFDGKCIVATITRRMMEFYGAKTEDIEGIVDQLRITKGIEVAILLHETDEQCYKVSMRSNDYVDVGKVASYFNGGGHVKAAGCTMLGSIHDVINNLTEQLAFQMK